MAKNNYISLACFLVIVLGLSFGISLLIAEDVSTWYAQLVHPPITPPNFVFAPVWTVIYIMIALSGWIVHKKGDLIGDVKWVYIFQLTLNYLWSVLFFYFHQIGLALVEIVILWLLILANIIYFYKYSKIAALLLFPYWFWVSFATILTLSFWIYN